MTVYAEPRLACSNLYQLCAKLAVRVQIEVSRQGFSLCVISVSHSFHTPASFSIHLGDSIKRTADGKSQNERKRQGGLSQSVCVCAVRDQRCVE